MSLTLHRGPAFGGADEAVRGAWAAGGGLLVLRDADAARDALLAAAGTDGVAWDREAVTPAGLRARVRSAAGRPEGEPPSRIGIRMAIQGALAERMWPGFGAAAGAPGFPGAVEGALAEVRAARLDARTLRAAATAVGAPAVADLADLLEALAPGPRLPVDDEWDAAEAAGDLERFPPVAVGGFDDLSPPAWALLRALARVTEVRVGLVFVPGRAAYRARAGRQGAWARDADEVVEHPAVAREERPPALSALDDGLFEDVAGPAAAPGGAVRWLEAAGTRGMHRAALLEVLRHHAEGVPLARIALVVPRLAESRDDLDRLLDDWGVPARRATRLRFFEAPLGLALGHLLALGALEAGTPGALDPMLGWLRSPYSGAPPQDVDRFEADMRAGRADERGPLLARWPGETARAARHVVRASGQGPRAQVAALLAAGEAGLARASAGRLLPGRADRRDLAVLGALAGLAAELEADEAEDGRPRGPVPAGAVGRLLAGLTLPDREGPPDGLAVLDYAGLRGRRFRVVVLCGLEAGGFPGRPAPDPFLDPVRAALGAALPPRAEGTDEGRLRFVQAVAAAGERLVMVRRAADDDGREMAPSPYWLETRRLLGRPVGGADAGPGALGEVPDDPASAPTRREALRSIAAAGGSAPGLLAGALARRRRPLGLSADAFAGEREFSVTALETYLRCPYGWFHDRVLRPQPLERPFDAAAEGSLGHGVLERLFAAMRDAGVGPCDAAGLPAYLAALPGVLDAVAEAGRPPAAGRAYAAFRVRLGRHLEGLLRREAHTGPRLLPMRFEQPIEDATLVAGAVITGVADRIDLSSDGAWALAVDYKRSGAVVEGEALQLPLYAEAAARASGARSAGGLYVGIAKSRIDGRVRRDAGAADALPERIMVGADDWRALVDDATARAAEAIAGIRAGRLGPPPDDCPPWCGHGALCR